MSNKNQVSTSVHERTCNEDRTSPRDGEDGRCGLEMSDDVDHGVMTMVRRRLDDDDQHQKCVVFWSDFVFGLLEAMTSR